MFATTGVTTQLFHLRMINLQQKLMVVMAAPVTSHKLVAIADLISRARNSIYQTRS
jgi:hypothetical protein